MIRTMLHLIIGMLLFATTISAAEKLSVVTSTSDLADFARQIGKDRVTVVSLSRGDQDPHGVEPRPSMVMQIKKADILMRVGMDLDMWVNGLIDASRNANVMKGAQGYLDVSEAIQKLEVPEGKIDGSMGDIHIYGNPHYWTNPENALLIIDEIYKRLCALRPVDTETFKRNYDGYADTLRRMIGTWKIELAPYTGSSIVTYHNSWPYFAACFNLKLAGFVEPKPGIPPTPAHVVALVETMKNSHAKVIVMEPYFNLKTAQSIAQKAGVKVLVLSPSVGGIKGTDSYIDLMSYNVKVLSESLQK